jgi:DNA-binding LytR/AlgR family response regulator
MSNIKILIVEDDMIIGAKISMKLVSLGYEVTGVIPRGEEAIVHVENYQPDIVLLDINLKGPLDGVETAKKILAKTDVPVIYVTANTDEATFNRAKATKPYAFISKPIKNLDLQRAIELTIERLNEKKLDISDEETSASELIINNTLPDRIFVKFKEKMIKIFTKDILYLSADRSYCRVFTKTDQYVLSVPLKSVESKLSTDLFVRVHRSYLVNITQIDEFEDNHVFVSGTAIPISPNLKDDLFKRLNRF